MLRKLVLPKSASLSLVGRCSPLSYGGFRDTAALRQKGALGKTRHGVRRQQESTEHGE